MRKRAMKNNHSQKKKRKKSKIGVDCPICLENVSANISIRLKCKHDFCVFCLCKHINSKSRLYTLPTTGETKYTPRETDDFACPICRTTENTVFVEALVKKTSGKYNCPHCDDIETDFEHIFHCSLSRQDCHYCQQDILISDMSHHIAKECAHIGCDVCTNSTTLRNGDEHTPHMFFHLNQQAAFFLEEGILLTNMSQIDESFLFQLLRVFYTEHTGVEDTSEVQETTLLATVRKYLASRSTRFDILPLYRAVALMNHLYPVENDDQ